MYVCKVPCFTNRDVMQVGQLFFFLRQRINELEIYQTDEQTQLDNRPSSVADILTKMGPTILFTIYFGIACGNHHDLDNEQPYLSFALLYFFYDIFCCTVGLLGRQQSTLQWDRSLLGRQRS